MAPPSCSSLTMVRGVWLILLLGVPVKGFSSSFSLVSRGVLAGIGSYNNCHDHEYSQKIRTIPILRPRLRMVSKSSNNKRDNTGKTSTTTEDDDVWEALQRLDELDAKLGEGVGASKERKKLHDIISSWEKAQLEQAEQQEEERQTEDQVWREEQQQDGDEDDENEECDPSTEDCNPFATTKFVPKHKPTDRIAIFGGDPARRRQVVEKKLAPFASLDQFGTPRDVGEGDTRQLLKKIESNSYDVVYLWIRFNCHSSRSQIREACLATGTTRFEEVSSLAYIQEL